MQKTSSANRKHIALYGNTNSGKSSLINAMIGQQVSIVSDINGTTTDPVSKTMELLPYGPVVFIDTAGLNDSGELGSLRMERTYKILQRTDFAIYVMDAENPDAQTYEQMIAIFKRYKIPHLLVINKVDLLNENEFNHLKDSFKNALLVSTTDMSSVLNLKDTLIQQLSKHEETDTIIGDLLDYDSKVIMVVPIDSEAPKGRIILPQVQLIRDCLDHGIKSYVVRDSELAGAIKDMTDIDLVVTDSQAFKLVAEIVPDNILLTSFSILFARYKSGNIDAFIRGASMIDKLQDNSRVLITESCTHNHSHEDIGRVKIPKLLKKHTGKDLNIEFLMGHDFPSDLSAFDLVIHCGSCMVNKKTMQTRIDFCQVSGTPITNYGITLAFLNGILDRSIQIFTRQKNE